MNTTMKSVDGYLLLGPCSGSCSSCDLLWRKHSGHCKAKICNSRMPIFVQKHIARLDVPMRRKTDSKFGCYEKRCKYILYIQSRIVVMGGSQLLSFPRWELYSWVPSSSHLLQSLLGSLTLPVEVLFIQNFFFLNIGEALWDFTGHTAGTYYNYAFRN